MGAKKNDNAARLKFTWALSIVMPALIFGFFYESFTEIRKFSPVKVAVEHIKAKAAGEQPGD